jgi:hypothetical protein
MLSDQSIVNAASPHWRPGYTRVEMRLLSKINSPTFTASINAQLMTPLSSDHFLRLFESYAANQFLTDAPSDEALDRDFRAYCLAKGPEMTAPRPLEVRRTKHPAAQSFMPYPTVDASAGGREMERPLR